VQLWLKHLIKHQRYRRRLSFSTKVTAQQRQQALYADQWWTLFGDAQLNQLVDAVLAKNADLAVAGMTLKQARLQAELAENQQKPRVNSTVSTGHQFDLN
jgi:outer membrane protein TolC